MLIGFRSFDLRQSPRCLGARVSIVQLHEQLALAHVLTLTYIDFSNRGCGRSVSFEVFDGLDLTVRGNRCNQILLGYMVNPDRNLAFAAGNKSGQTDNSKNGDDYPTPNVLAIAVALSGLLCHQENKLKVYRSESVALSCSLARPHKALDAPNLMPEGRISVQRHLNESRFHLNRR